MPINTCQPFPSLIDLTPSRYGHMFYLTSDQYVGRSFEEYGEFSQGEIDLFTHLVPPGAFVLDVGANIGAHTIPLAQLAGPGGMVLAFEPQPILCQILCANLAVNSITNTRTHALALGNHQGTCQIPILDYAASNNFGGISMDMVDTGETVPMITLDDLQLDRVDFMKLDVEGFESQVLEGAKATIDRSRPVMYVENDREEKSSDLIQRLFDLGYRLWWHAPPLFSPNNFKGNPEDVFPRIFSINMLAVHRDQPFQTDLRPITSAGDTYW